jgi:hypothetical protein
MVEPLHTMWRSVCVIILAVLRSISSGLSRKNRSSIIIIQFKKAAPKFARCHHKFSVHGHDNHNCKYRHAMNYATGI